MNTASLMAQVLMPGIWAFLDEVSILVLLKFILKSTFFSLYHLTMIKLTRRVKHFGKYNRNCVITKMT